MEAETPAKKVVFAGQAGVWMLFFAVTGGIYLAAMNRANAIDDSICNPDDPFMAGFQVFCTMSDNKIYDLAPLLYG